MRTKLPVSRTHLLLVPPSQPQALYIRTRCYLYCFFILDIHDSVKEGHSELFKMDFHNFSVPNRPKNPLAGLGGPECGRRHWSQFDF